MADYQDFRRILVRSRAHDLRFRVRNASTRALLNITNYTDFRFTAKEDPSVGDSGWVFSKTLDDGSITKLDATNGRLQIEIEAIDTASLLSGRTTELLAELQCVDDSGRPRSLARGRILVEPEISQTTP